LGNKQTLALRNNGKAGTPLPPTPTTTFISDYEPTVETDLIALRQKYKHCVGQDCQPCKADECAKLISNKADEKTSLIRILDPDSTKHDKEVNDILGDILSDLELAKQDPNISKIWQSNLQRDIDRLKLATSGGNKRKTHRKQIKKRISTKAARSKKHHRRSKK